MLPCCHVIAAHWLRYRRKLSVLSISIGGFTVLSASSIGLPSPSQTRESCVQLARSLRSIDTVTARVSQGYTKLGGLYICSTWLEVAVLYGRGLDRIFFRRGHFVLAFTYSFGMDTGVAWVAVARVSCNERWAMEENRWTIRGHAVQYR